MAERVHLAGGQFGNLLVLHRDPNKSGYWICKCLLCDNIISVNSNNLLLNKVKRCQDCRSTQNNLSTSTEYKSWASINRRCYDINDKSYLNYGGRGIYVCQRWHTFLNFYEDMGNKPTKKYTIERIDNNNSYTCGKCPECIEKNQSTNCKWDLRQPQARNRRTNVSYTYNNETHILKEWSEILNINYATLWDRINIGGKTFKEAILNIDHRSKEYKDKKDKEYKELYAKLLKEGIK